MGCWYSRENRCYSLSCCFCYKPKTACYWIGAVGLVWGGLATCVDFANSYLPRQPCKSCLDYELHADLCFASGWINAVQWIASTALIHGVRKGLSRLLLLWLGWSVVSLLMLATWIAITLPYFPSVRGFFSLLQLVWGIHYCIVVRTQYSMMALSFSPPEEPLRPVPPNSPTRKHKRRRRRLDPGAQPPIRTLVGVATRLQKELARRPDVSDEGEEPEVVVISREAPSEGQRGRRRRRRREEEEEEEAPEAGGDPIPPETGSLRESPTPEGETRILVVTVEVPRRSSLSMVPFAGPSAAEGEAGDPLPSMGPSGDPCEEGGNGKAG